MPNYDYVCRKCGRTFEVFQSMNDPHLDRCLDEACGGTMKRKLGTGAGFIFKGAGFYTTDYRSSSYKEGAKKESKESKEGSGGDSPAPSKKEGSGGGDSPAPSKKEGGSSPTGGGSSGGAGGNAA